MSIKENLIVFPLKYLHGYVVLCFVLFVLKLLVESYEDHSSYIFQGWFIVLKWLNNCPSAVILNDMGKIGHYQITTQASYMCEIFGMYCKSSSLTHYALVMPYGNIDLGQHWLR